MSAMARAAITARVFMVYLEILRSGLLPKLLGSLVGLGGTPPTLHDHNQRLRAVSNLNL